MIRIESLFSLLMILVLSRIAGCRGWDATADWASAHFDLLRRYLDLWQTPPGADTLRRTAQAYDLDDFLDGIVAEDGTVQIDGKRARPLSTVRSTISSRLCAADA